MDISDIIPINPLAEMFDIPDGIRWLIFFLIFLFGYVSLKYFEKSIKINKKLNSIDMIFLITFFGLVILLKIFFIFFFSLGMILVPFSGTLDLTSIIIGLIFFIFIIILCIQLFRVDILSIINKNKEYDKNKRIGWLVFSVFLTSIFVLVTVNLWKVSPNFAKFTYLMLIIGCFITLNPTIYYFLNWYKKFIT